mgnify:CR=1 FL=1
MSLKNRNRSASNIWPGFVDALATLLMVIMFLLMVFVLAQFFLGQWVVVEYLNAGQPEIVETGLDSNRQATSLALQFRQETKGVPTAA